MAVSVPHEIKLIAVNDPKLAYKFIVRCSCQWEGLAWTRQVAERWIGSHVYAQTIRGNECTVDRGDLQEANVNV